MVRNACERDACRRDGRAAFAAAFARKTAFVTARTEIFLFERVELRSDRLVTIDARKAVGLEREKRHIRVYRRNGTRVRR